MGGLWQVWSLPPWQRPPRGSQCPALALPGPVPALPSAGAVGDAAVLDELEGRAASSASPTHPREREEEEAEGTFLLSRVVSLHSSCSQRVLVPRWQCTHRMRAEHPFAEVFQVTGVCGFGKMTPWWGDI